MNLSRFERTLLIVAMLQELRARAMAIEVSIGSWDLAEVQRRMTDLLNVAERIKEIAADMTD